MSITFNALSVTGGAVSWVTPSTAQALSPEVLVAAMNLFVEQTGVPATVLIVNTEDASFASGLVFNYLGWEAFNVRVVEGMPTGAWIMLGETGGIVSGGGAAE